MPLTVGRVLAWADAHRQRTGEWPSADSGRVAGQAGQTWAAVEKALSLGLRGLPGGDSLSRLLVRERDAPRRRRPADRGRLLWAARLRARGLTLVEIGRRLGVTHQRVAQLLRKVGQGGLGEH
jgi:hypothetical protein